MDTTTLIALVGVGVAVVGVLVAGIVGLCTYLWKLSDKMNTISDRLARLEGKWDVQFAERGKSLTTSSESVTMILKEE